jgi:hypothetical protein
VKLSASGFTGVGWRFYASSADTSVPKASNTDQFASLGSAAPEVNVVSLPGGHLDPSHAIAQDAIAFIERRLAA